MEVSDDIILEKVEALQKEMAGILDEMLSIVDEYKLSQQGIAQNEKTPQVENPGKINSMLIWNSFMKMVKAEMESSGRKISYAEVRRKAIEMKNLDPDSYKIFSENFTL